MIKSYLIYWLKSKKVSTINHPFINKLYVSVFIKLQLVNDSKIVGYKNRLKQNKLILNITDLGAGSKKNKSNSRSVQSIAKNVSISPKFGKLLNNLIETFNCETVIELGTSLGVGTSYLALSNKTKVFTIEGCPKISEFTQQQLSDTTNVSFFVGEFSTQLDAVLKQSGQPNLVYIDGNHTYEGTITYFNYFLKHSQPNAILVFDDIHWDKGMEKAWQEIVASEKVKISLDLFRMGVVFLDENLDKKHFNLKF